MGSSQKKELTAMARKAYEKPYLQVYGDLAEITNNVGNAGSNPDSGGYYHHSRTH